MDENDLKLRIMERSQAHIAAAMGISTSHMGRIYAGECGVTLEHLGAFLNALDLMVTPDDTQIMHIESSKLEALRTMFEMVVGDD